MENFWRSLAFVELRFDRLPEFEIVTVSQDKEGFWNLPEFLQCLIKRMLSGIGVKALEQLRRGRHLQLDGGNKAQNIIPLILNKTFADVAIRQQRVSLRLVVPAVLKGVELLAAQSFDPRCKLETQEVSYAKDDLRIAMRVGRMHVALDHVIVHQPIDDVGRFPFGGS